MQKSWYYNLFWLQNPLSLHFKCLCVPSGLAGTQLLWCLLQWSLVTLISLPPQTYSWVLGCRYVWKSRNSNPLHYTDVIMSAMASQITSLTIVYSPVYSGTDQRKHQRSASLASVCVIHRWPVNSSHKGPVTRKIFPFDDVIMISLHTVLPVLYVRAKQVVRIIFQWREQLYINTGRVTVTQNKNV